LVFVFSFFKAYLFFCRSSKEILSVSFLLLLLVSGDLEVGTLRIPGAKEPGISLPFALPNYMLSKTDGEFSKVNY
jgi:hypothetical protein